MVFADIRSLCKLIISYFTPIFLTLISYIFELKIYILHQSALGSLPKRSHGRPGFVGSEIALFSFGEINTHLLAFCVR